MLFLETGREICQENSSSEERGDRHQQASQKSDAQEKWGCLQEVRQAAQSVAVRHDRLGEGSASAMNANTGSRLKSTKEQNALQKAQRHREDVAELFKFISFYLIYLVGSLDKLY